MLSVQRCFDDSAEDMEGISVEQKLRKRVRVSEVRLKLGEEQCSRGALHLAKRRQEDNSDKDRWGEEQLRRRGQGGLGQAKGCLTLCGEP